MSVGTRYVKYYPQFDERDLNQVMEIDHVIEVHEKGMVTDGPEGIYAPEHPMDGVLEDRDWEVFSVGYTGQEINRQSDDGTMHNDEYIAGKLADDILASPGLYVALAASWSHDCDELQCDPDVECEDRDEIEDEGWIVAKYTLTY